MLQLYPYITDFFLFILQYFNHPEEFWAAETPEVPCKVGDIVKIEELSDRVTPTVTHQVCEHVFKIGEVVDPVTGRKCRATSFIDESMREKIKSELEKKSGNWFK